MTFYPASFVRRPSLCRNYDSASGMQRRVPRWHPFALLGDNNSNSAKRAGVLSGRSPPRVSHAAPEASPPTTAPHPSPLFAKVRAQSAELFTSNCLAGSGCRCYCFFCVWFCLLAPSFLSPPASRRRWLPGRLACEFLKSWKKKKPWPVKEELRPWLLHLVNWVFFFLIFFAFTAKSTK